VLQWYSKQVALAHQLASPNKHEAYQFASALAGQAPISAADAKSKDSTKCLGGLIMQRNQAFSGRLPNRNTEPRRPVGILIKTVGGEAANLIAPRPGPTSNNQGCALKRIRKGPDSIH
jgi:hypothetical protein